MDFVFPSGVDMGGRRKPRTIPPVDSSERKAGPKGLLRDIDDAWRAKVSKKMETAGPDETPMSRAELARACKVTPSAITVMFRPTTKQCKFRDRVEKALGMIVTDSPQALAIERDARLRRMMKIRAALADDAKLDRWLAIGEDLADLSTTKH